MTRAGIENSLRSLTVRALASLAWIAAYWLALGSVVSAQSTGGSAGGSSWGGSGSSGGGGGGSGSYGGGSSYAGAATNSYEPPVWAQLLIAIAFLAFLYFLFRAIGRASMPPKVGVTTVRIALDARARRFVQDALAALAETTDTSTPSGLVALLVGVSRALVGTKIAWIYCGIEQLAPLAPPQARIEHAKRTQDARARFQHELVRNADGTTQTTDAPALVAREHEGEGVVVVSLIVATRTSPIAASASKPDEVVHVLGALARPSPSGVAPIGAGWSTSAQEDPTSIR